MKIGALKQILNIIEDARDNLDPGMVNSGEYKALQALAEAFSSHINLRQQQKDEKHGKR